MLVLLVRHGHAGSKRHWEDDDSFRPLNEQGLAESVALSDLITPFAPTRILSSPFRRCMQSVAPLARALQIHVEQSTSLIPDAGSAATSLALGVTAQTAGPVVLCTHGEVIRDMQVILAQACMGSFRPDGPREKASVWVLDRVDGQFVSASYLPPPRTVPIPGVVDRLC